MELTLKTFLIVLPLIFMGGFIDSIAGGGGIITIPAYLLAGIPIHLAAGTNKVVNGSGTLVATINYFRSGKIQLRPAVIAAAGALIGSSIGAKLATLIPDEIFKVIMLVALPCVAIFLTLKKDFGKETTAELKEYSVQKEALVSAAIGLGIGCYDGLIGPGTGTFLIICFTTLLSMDLVTASGCSKTANLASNVGAAVVWILNGQVLWSMAIPAIQCSILGNYLGARYAIKGGSKRIRKMIFVVLGLLFLKMLYDLFLG